MPCGFTGLAASNHLIITTKMKSKNLIVGALVCCVLLSRVTSRAATNDSSGIINNPMLSLSICCTNEVVKAGDEIPVEFRITNRGTNDYKYADRTYDRSGRMEEYRLVPKKRSGEVVSDPRAGYAGGWFGGGLFQYRILKPGESFTKVIPLNRWALVKEPGRYIVTGTYLSELYSTNSEDIVSPPIAIDVQPRTEKEMEAYIARLTNQLASAASDELFMKLMFTCNPKIVPALLNAMYESGQGGFWEAEALNFYVPHSESTKREIVTFVNQRGLAGGMQSVLYDYGYTNGAELEPIIARSLAPDNPRAWQAGASAAQQYANDVFTPRLIALAMVPGNSARTQAMDALAANRTDESVKALKSLLNDPDPTIRAETERAIRVAYNWRGIWQGRRLKSDDFDEKYQRPDPLK